MYTRRSFVRTGVLASVAAGAGTEKAFAGAPAIRRSAARPIVVASSNANVFTNGGQVTCVEDVFRRLTAGEDVLDAIIAGVTIVERDPEETSVGYDGLPNADGVVQLDACCMHGPKKRAGGVAALEGVRTPSEVARAVMEYTDHHLLVGRDAQTFARNMGFEIEADLNSPRSRRLWLDWKRQTDPVHYLHPENRIDMREDTGSESPRGDGMGARPTRYLDREHVYGTIHCSALSPAGGLAGVTSTSGRAWKIPGRVGDSPILGAGLYVDGDVGAAGSTGRGEANLYGLGSFLVVESMRRGMAPKDAAVEALNRIRAATIERRLLNSRGEPNFNVSYYVLAANGEYAGVSLYASDEPLYSICTENGAEDLEMEGLIEGER